MARVTANEKKEKIAVKSLLGSNLWYKDIIIKAHEIVLLDKEDAEHLLENKFCEEIKVSEK